MHGEPEPSSPPAPQALPCTVLRGKITGVSGADLTFEPEYGKGAIVIKWEDVEDVKTDGPFQILYGDGEEADAPLQGFSDGAVLASGRPDEIIYNENVRKVYLGEHFRL